MHLSRRHALAGGLLLPWAESALSALRRDTFRDLELGAGGRLGICVLDTGTGRIFGHRLDERFAMCSTFKLPLAALRSIRLIWAWFGWKRSCRSQRVIGFHIILWPGL